LSTAIYIENWDDYSIVWVCLFATPRVLHLYVLPRITDLESWAVFLLSPRPCEGNNQAEFHVSNN
jgi:hypothetical protein